MMTEPNDNEIIRVRLEFLDICKSFFDAPPDAERLARWRGLFAALINERVAPGMDRAVRELWEILNQLSLADLQDEYYRLFVDPFGELRVPLSASEYFEGRSHGRTLAEFRGFLQEVGIRRMEEVTEAEDSLVVMLDVWARLVEDEEMVAERSQQQHMLVETYLAPLTHKFTEALADKDGIVFYPACAGFLQGYMELEQRMSAEAG